MLHKKSYPQKPRYLRRSIDSIIVNILRKLKKWIIQTDLAYQMNQSKLQATQTESMALHPSISE